MNTLVAFRQMTEEDIEQIVKIEQASFAIPWTYEAFERELIVNEFACYTVMEENGQIIGYCGLWIILDESHITNIAVLPEYRGRKLGEMLLQKVMEKAINLGAKTMTLEVRVSNEPAKKLYRKMGFQDGGIRKKYYTDNGEDALVMWVNL
ncbi:ribosomal protein S18-alanine N-acetyltransferase [Bacillus sp. 165]|uniref:ribosomal protein S18-alanine N-acetyltransferase n=1 Tax=Bacillus sp. 165 TaxID=1529117 RepID=UPI001ADA4E7B|nr:ribosomal protein S18-alanine N-acetyltransferase [Bacillus sp. 165]MBO9131416.1 ribosomal protein S18-alanine N-acetyltransferase [Bacillus sp. 165]